jgi:DNA-binding response OmpR family regulator
VLDRPSILHVCQREMLRPLRDQILRLSGFEVDSALEHTEAFSRFRQRSYDLVLIDVEGEGSIPGAETLCSEIKTARPEQLVAFVCNWRVAVLTDCPDEIVRTEFNPEAFVAGVRKIVASQETSADETAKSEQSTTL